VCVPLCVLIWFVHFRLERPKVLYNAARRYYVLMFALSSLDRSRAEVGWAVGVGPYGPFKFDGSRCVDGAARFSASRAGICDKPA